MYTVTAIVNGTEYPLHDIRSKRLTLGGSPYFEIGDNINGQAEFTVYAGHPYYDKVKKLVTEIVFYKDGNEKFRGRVLNDREMFDGSKKVFVEGELAYFCDSIQRPKDYHDISVRDYADDLIENHNDQVENRKHFTLGVVTVTDPNDSLYRHSNWENTRELLKDRLVNRLGGHLVVRWASGTRYLDYLSDATFYENAKQEIRFGRNLLDFSRNMTAADVITCLIPLGARLETDTDSDDYETVSESYDDLELEQRLTIESVNDGVDYITDANAVATYGKIYGTQIWDDVTVAATLLLRGREFLTTVQYEKMVLECKAVDLNLSDSGYEELKIGHRIHCISEPNGMDVWLPLSKKRTYITDFAKNTLTLGTTAAKPTYTSTNVKTTSQITKTIQSLPTKGEILKKAMEDATKLINLYNQKGYAMHFPSEFIVADNEDITQALMMWRWGLGGLAHYSHGYEGSADGVALTMDGKINGRMLIAESVTADAINVGYTNAMYAAMDNRDGSVLSEVTSSLTNTAELIRMSITSTRRAIQQQNKVVNGEEATLNVSSYTVVTNSIATVTVDEWLNTNCFKIEFTGNGTVSISQSLGELPDGDYTFEIQYGWPEDDTGGEFAVDHCPSGGSYGLVSNARTIPFISTVGNRFYIDSYALTLSGTSTRAIMISVTGEDGTVCYITNIRVLRKIDDIIDELRTSLTVTDGLIAAEVTRATAAEGTLSSRVTQTETGLSAKVSKGSVISEINQSAESVSILASKISLTGAVSINNTFKIDTSGYPIMTGGYIGGFEIANSKIRKESYNSTEEDHTFYALEICGYTDYIAPYARRTNMKLVTRDYSGNSIEMCERFVKGSDTNRLKIDACGIIDRWADTIFDSNAHSTFARTEFNGNVLVNSAFEVGSGFTKSIAADTEDYGKQLYYCYEMPTPMFGDIGSAQIDESGSCIVMLDDIFVQSSSTEKPYQVFVQKCGDGDLWISQKEPSFFVVRGTPGLLFDWEVKAKQLPQDQRRFKDYSDDVRTVDYEVIDYERTGFNDIESIVNIEDEMIETSYAEAQLEAEHALKATQGALDGWNYEYDGFGAADVDDAWNGCASALFESLNEDDEAGS